MVSWDKERDVVILPIVCMVGTKNCEHGADDIRTSGRGVEWCP